MGKWKETEEVYCMDKEEKVIPETNCCTGFVQSLDRLHKMRDMAEQLELYDYLDHLYVTHLFCSTPDTYGRYVHLHRKKYKPRNQNKKRW